MDDDDVLRELGADLAQDDPRLAALLTGTDDEPHGHVLLLLLLILGPPLLMGLLLLNEAVFGTVTMLLALATPLIVWRVFPPASGRPTTG